MLRIQSRVNIFKGCLNVIQVRIVDRGFNMLFNVNHTNTLLKTINKGKQLLNKKILKAVLSYSKKKKKKKRFWTFFQTWNCFPTPQIFLTIQRLKGKGNDKEVPRTINGQDLEPWKWNRKRRDIMTISPE